jgi:hypothetical protein
MIAAELHARHGDQDQAARHMERFNAWTELGKR